MVIKNADEAEKAVLDFLKRRFDAPDATEVWRIAFDGTYFSVSGHWESERGRYDFKVKLDKDGNAVGWKLTSPPTV